LKRGHNFGVVYVTNPPTEDVEDSFKNKKSEAKAKMMDAEVRNIFDLIHCILFID
jgi:hypothetical protein